MSKTKTDDRMYTSTPCDKCAGPTLQIGQGSIWCPSEDCTPGGHFVVRVAFARPPKRDADGNWERTALPQRTPRQPVARIASQPTAKPVVIKPANDGFDTGLDGFIEKPR